LVLDALFCRFYIATDDSEKGARIGKEIVGTFANSADDIKKIGQFFFLKTRELIERQTYHNVVGKVSNVDIVRDVLKTVPLYWAATEIVRVQAPIAPGAGIDRILCDRVGST
jgi:linoleate 10R-lipoxygenase